MSTVPRASWAPLALTLAATFVAGCGDRGESGPGTLDGRVTSASSSLGAVILEIRGEGVTRVSGRGATRAFSGLDSGATRRVILVGSGSDELTFEVDLEDVDARPAVTVASAVDASNLEITALAGIDVRLSSR